MKEGLLQLNDILMSLEPLHRPLEAPGGSVLLRELVNAPSSSEGPMLSSGSTPLLHALSAAHAYITMFVHVCRVGQVRLVIIATFKATELNVQNSSSHCAVFVLNFVGLPNGSSYTSVEMMKTYLLHDSLLLGSTGLIYYVSNTSHFQILESLNH